MAGKILKTALALLGGVVILLAGAYVFRAGLLRTGINTFLADDVAITRLEGVQLSTTHASVKQLELTLVTSGQHLTVSDMDLDFSMSGLFSTPVVNTLVIGSARLADAAVSSVQTNSSPTAADEPAVGDSSDAGMLLSELLQLLRDFPIAKVELNNLDVPQFRQPLVLAFNNNTSDLQFRIATGALQLLASFTQADTAAPARFTLNLQADAATVADMNVSLQPEGAGYQLAGSGNVAFSDANNPFAAYLTTPLPFSSLALGWDLAARVSNEVLTDPADNITLGVLPGASFVLREGMFPRLGELVVSIPERAEVNIVPGAQLSIGAGRIPVDISGIWQEQAVQIAVVVSPDMCVVIGTLACSAGFDGNATLAAYTIMDADPAAAISISTLEFSGGGTVAISDERASATLNPGARFGTGSVAAPAVSLVSLSAVSDSMVEVSSSFADQELTVSAAQVALAFAELKAGEYQTSPAFTLRDLSLVSGENPAGKITVQTPALAVTGPHWIPSVGLDATISVDGDQLTFSTPLLLPNAPADVQLAASGTYNLAAGTGSAKVTLPALTLTGEGNSLSSYLGGWPYPADVMTGTLALDLDVQLQREITAPATTEADAAGSTVISGSTKIVLTDVAGFYEESFFRGLNTTIDGVYDSSAPTLPITTPPLSLTVDELNVGMSVTDIALAYQLDARSQILTVNSISAAVLDGTVTGSDISYDFSKERNDMTFMFSGLRLERMVDLTEYEGIEAIGAVSGELPVTITGTQVEVDAGKLYAEAPGGSIRYLDAPTAGQGNPAMDLVNQALSNYQFQSLESTIDYTPDGELLLSMQLRGNNPDMNGGQPINLNLNISDNIPTLLRSLQAGRAIEDFLQEQYK